MISSLTALTGFAGFAFGLLHFAALKRTTVLLVSGQGWLGPLALTLGRIGATVIFLFLAVKLGAGPLLAAFAGFLLARALALRAGRRAA
ncbi:MAG: ATP synthase subunit I [Rhodanobacteraceae bacterium]